MAYLSKTDYLLSIAIDHLDEILDQAALTGGLTADQIRAKHEDLAMARIKVVLFAKYNMAAEFGLDSSSSSRDSIVVSLVVDLALCSLHKTINPRDIPERVDNACTAAMQLLNDIRDGLTGLNTVPVVTNQLYTSFIDSQPKFISKEFTDLSILKPDSI
jgi:hypothetical protein